MGVGAYVKVLGLAAKQQVAHAAADEVGYMALIGQTIEDLQRVGVDVAPGDFVLRSRPNRGLSVLHC